ncbi:MAG: helix-turn-helix transcriptional regulator [archaeon]
MKWEGSAIRKSAEAQGLSLADLARQVGVSRQAVNDWIGGQIPKGLFLITLCDILNLDPDELFIKEPDKSVQVLVYRPKRKSKVNPEQEEQMKELAGRYKKLFPSTGPTTIRQTLTVSDFNEENAKVIAAKLSQMSGVPEENPLDYLHAFKLLQTLDIYVIFSEFPVSKLYAFYTCINNHRVVFINFKTNLLDLIFPLLHETVHSIIRNNKTMLVEDAEEDFCDMVASSTQFPDVYINEIFNLIRIIDPGKQINALKDYCRKNHHAMCGIIKRIKKNNPEFNLSYGGADNVLRREFDIMEKVLHESDNVRKYIQTYRELSPLFINLIIKQIEDLSPRILGEIFSLENYSDMECLKDELHQIRNLEVTAER